MSVKKFTMMLGRSTLRITSFVWLVSKMVSVWLLSTTRAGIRGFTVNSTRSSLIRSRSPSFITQRSSRYGRMENCFVWIVRGSTLAYDSCWMSLAQGWMLQGLY